MAKKELDFTTSYTPSSKKEEDKPSTKMSPVEIKGDVSVKKRGAWGRFWHDLRHRDFKAIMDTGIEDVVIPAILDGAADFLHYAVDRFIYKDDVRTAYKRKSVFSSDGSVGYGYWKSSQSSTRKHDPRPNPNESITYAELQFRGNEGKMAINNIIDSMVEYSHKYQESGVTIPKLYEFIEESLRMSNNESYKDVMASLKKLEWTDSKYGWDEEAIRQARPMRVGGGAWVLDLPSPKYLD